MEIELILQLHSSMDGFRFIFLHDCPGGNSHQGRVEGSEAARHGRTAALCRRPDRKAFSQRGSWVRRALTGDVSHRWRSFLLLLFYHVSQHRTVWDFIRWFLCDVDRTVQRSSFILLIQDVKVMDFQTLNQPRAPGKHPTWSQGLILPTCCQMWCAVTLPRSFLSVV